MREWIQTLLIALLVFLFCGAAFLSLDQARKRDHALLTSLESANAAMIAALDALYRTHARQPDSVGEQGPTLAAQPAGAAAASARMIHIAVRRGDASGPPAEGVEVRFRSALPEGLGLEVSDYTKADGAVSFGPVGEGKYALALVDPRSGMKMREYSVVRFAGRGQEDILIVAPDAVPRPVRLDAGLATAGSDEDLFLLSAYRSYWGSEPCVWESEGVAVLGKSGVWHIDLPAGQQPDFASLTADRLTGLKTPLETAGNRLSIERLELYAVREDGGLQKAATGDAVTSVSLDLPPSMTAPLPLDIHETILKAYEDLALERLVRKLGVPVPAPLLRSLQQQFPQEAPVFASTLQHAKTGYWKEAGGAVQFRPFVSSRLMIFEPVEGSAGMVAAEFPALSGQAFSEHARFGVALRIKPQSAVTNRIFIDGRNTDYAFTHYIDNTLLAFPLLTPWSPGESEKILRLGPDPLWQGSPDQLKQGSADFIFVDVTSAYVNAAAPVHGMALRWRDNTAQGAVRGIQIFSILDEEKNPGLQPHFLVLEPVESALARIDAGVPAAAVAE